MWYPSPQLGKYWATSNRFFFFLFLGLLETGEEAEAPVSVGFGEPVLKLLRKLDVNLHRFMVRSVIALCARLLAIFELLLCDWYGSDGCCSFARRRKPIKKFVLLRIWPREFSYIGIDPCAFLFMQKLSFIIVLFLFHFFHREKNCIFYLFHCECGLIVNSEEKR